MYLWLLIPFAIQTIFMILDEYVFHIARKLPLWERVGHPIDTASVLSIYLFVLLFPYNALHLKWFVGLGILSCLLITKDEFVHKHHCNAKEQWLHAVLFINHPILLTSIGLCWPALHGGETVSWIGPDIEKSSILFPFFLVQTILITGFLIYQITYWNFIWKDQKNKA